MKHIFVLVLLFVLLACPTPARADISPPIYPPGSNPQPGMEGTQVRMVAETVLIEILRDIAPQSLGRARVTTDFSMRNLGTADESMAVRFPITANDGRGNYPEIGNLQISVNGSPVPYRRVNYPGIQYMREEVPWAEFDVTFPAGQEAAVRVTYELAGSGYYPFTAYYYILETGAGWKDTIGSADVILRLPYEASPQNVILSGPIGWAETTPGGTIQGNEVRWHFEEFEPGPDQPVQNMEFALVAPSAWQEVLTARAAVEKNPNDGEAWGRLARAYKQIFFFNRYYREDAGGQELYELSVEAYEKCLSLKPDDAQWHAGFADLLAEHATWEAWSSGPTPETYRALNEIRIALELAPSDPVVLQIAEDMTYSTYGGITQSGDRFDFPWLTQTPTALPTRTPTALPSSTPVGLIAEDHTPSPLPDLTGTPPVSPTQASTTGTKSSALPQGSSPICGSAALIVLAGTFWFHRKHK